MQVSLLDERFKALNTNKWTHELHIVWLANEIKYVTEFDVF